MGGKRLRIDSSLSTAGFTVKSFYHQRAKWKGNDTTHGHSLASVCCGTNMFELLSDCPGTRWIAVEYLPVTCGDVVTDVPLSLSLSLSPPPCCLSVPDFVCMLGFCGQSKQNTAYCGDPVEKPTQANWVSEQFPERKDGWRTIHWWEELPD